jgi:hypothetical protein
VDVPTVREECRKRGIMGVDVLPSGDIRVTGGPRSFARLKSEVFNQYDRNAGYGDAQPNNR